MSKGPSLATQLIALAAAEYDFGCTPAGDTFAVKKGDLVVQRLRGGGGSLRQDLIRKYRKQNPGAVVNTSALRDTMLNVDAEAGNEAYEPIPTNLRFALPPGERTGVLIDLANPQVGNDKVLMVGAGYWRLISAKELDTWGEPVLFHRSSVMGAMPVPSDTLEHDASDLMERGLARQRSLINVTDECWPLLLAWELTSMMPGIATPVLPLFGEHGSGKTTAAEFIRTLVDPSMPLFANVRSAKDWPVVASEFSVMALDNLSYISPEFSDMLCQSVTGYGDVRRQLFTDGGLVGFQFMNSVLLTSIGVGAIRGDLADRMLKVTLEVIPDDRRREEKEVHFDFAQGRTEMFTGLVALLSEVLYEIAEGNATLDEYPRMSGYAKVLRAVDLVLGTNGLETYLEQAATLSLDVLNGDSVYAALCKLVANAGGTWDHGTKSDLYAALQAFKPAMDDTWPKNVQSFGTRLTRLAPNMRKIGWEPKEYKPERGATERFRITAPDSLLVRASL